MMDTAIAKVSSNAIDMSFGKWGVLPTSVNAESNLRMWYTSTFYRKKGK